ncbi:MAG: hypothetical protein ACQER7_12090 [Bacteroidota bacterium]
MFLIFSNCKDDNEKEPEPKEHLILTEFQKKLKEYNLFEGDEDFESYIITRDSAWIYFFGQKDKKQHVECFNRETKENILSWTENSMIDTMVTLNAGYGEEETFKINEYRPKTVFKDKSQHIFILFGISGTANKGLSDLYFLSGDSENYTKKESFINPEGNESWYSDIYSWFQTSCIVKKMEQGHGNEGYYEIYDYNARRLFKTEGENLTYNDDDVNIKGKSLFENDNYFPISFFECILTGNNTSDPYRKINIEKGKVIWEVQNPLHDLPDDTRIDNVEFANMEGDSIQIQYEYTLFSGETGDVTIEMNSETGNYKEVSE